VRAGDEISGLYDPMIAKLIVHDTTRETARRRMLRALAEFRIEGPPTLIGFHAALLTEPCFIDGGTCHGIVESEELAQRADEMTEMFSHRATAVVNGSDGGQTRERVVAVEVDGRAFDVRLHTTEPLWAPLGRRRRERAAAGGAAGSGAVASPMQGTVLKVLVGEGDPVTVGQVICVIEAMKMENEIAAPRDGVVTDLGVATGQGITNGQLICVVAAAG
jgi:acetyl-CoA/propionyl-CoA carboxylase biotin carboxyl carrier protein